MPTSQAGTRALILATALIWCAHNAAAQGQAIGPCAADVQSHCAGVQHGEGRIRGCLEEHFNALSEACKPRIAKAEAVDKSCGGGIKLNCSGVEPGRGHILACLRKALDRLSPACRDLVVQAASR